MNEPIILWRRGANAMQDAVLNLFNSIDTSRMTPHEMRSILYSEVSKLDPGKFVPDDLQAVEVDPKP